MTAMSDPFLLRTHRGDTEQFIISVTDPSTGDPVNLTTFHLRFTAKYKTSDTDDDAVIVKTDTYGGIDLQYDEGVAIITLDPEDTIDLPKTTTLVWDLQITDSTGVVRTAAPPAGKVARLIIYADVSVRAP